MRAFSVIANLLIVTFLLIFVAGAPQLRRSSASSMTSSSQLPLAGVNEARSQRVLSAFGRTTRAGVLAHRYDVNGPVVRERSRFSMPVPLTGSELAGISGHNGHRSLMPIAGYSEFANALINGSSPRPLQIQVQHGPRNIHAVTANRTGSASGRMVSTNIPAVTGIEPWWTYEQDTIGGTGAYAINIATGNLIVQAEDMHVPSKGLGLMYQRTYNSLSGETYAETDGSLPSLYGDNWTSTFDTHVSYNQLSTNGSCGTQFGISVFTVDGAREDYAPSGDCRTWIPPAGVFAQLFIDSSGYINWLGKSGTSYIYEPISNPPDCGGKLGCAGMIHEIVGRNANCFLEFGRTWSPDASDPHNLQSLTVTSEAGQAAILQFANFSAGGQTFRLLSTLQWPDGTTITYAYQIYQHQDNSYFPELYQVTKPSNGASTQPVETYLYWGNWPLLE